VLIILLANVGIQALLINPAYHFWLRPLLWLLMLMLLFLVLLTWRLLLLLSVLLLTLLPLLLLLLPQHWTFQGAD